MNQTALITGATSGIGKATAEIFAKNKMNFENRILCGRCQWSAANAIAGTMMKANRIECVNPL